MKVIENLTEFLTETFFWIITLLTWCMHIQNNVITPVTPKNYVSYPVTNELYSFNSWYYSVVYKKSYSQLMILVSYSIEKIIMSCS